MFMRYLYKFRKNELIYPILFLVVLSMFTNRLEAQNLEIIVGTVYEGLSGKPIQDVVVSFQNPECGNTRRTGKNGDFIADVTCKNPIVVLGPDDEDWETLDADTVYEVSNEAKRIRGVHIQLCQTGKCNEEREKWKVIKQLINRPLSEVEHKMQKEAAPIILKITSLEKEQKSAVTQKGKKKYSAAIKKEKSKLGKVYLEFVNVRRTITLEGLSAYQIAKEKEGLSRAYLAILNGDAEAAQKELDNMMKVLVYSDFSPEMIEEIENLKGVLKIIRLKEDSENIASNRRTGAKGKHPVITLSDGRFLRHRKFYTSGFFQYPVVTGGEAGYWLTQNMSAGLRLGVSIVDNIGSGRIGITTEFVLLSLNFNKRKNPTSVAIVPRLGAGVDTRDEVYFFMGSGLRYDHNRIFIEPYADLWYEGTGLLGLPSFLPAGGINVGYYFLSRGLKKRL